MRGETNPSPLSDTVIVELIESCEKNHALILGVVLFASWNGYTISAALLHKLNGAYSGTGWNTDVSEDHLIGSFGVQAPGSYCLMLTVKESDSINIVMEVPYYFVIKSAS